MSFSRASRSSSFSLARTAVLASFLGALLSLWLDARPRGDLLVRYIGNEGFLISSGGESVLIDALHNASGTYEGPREIDLDALIVGKPPFDSVTHLLFSHRHYDHFESALAARYLGAHTAVGLTSSPQVVDPVADLLTSKAQLHTVLPDPGQSLQFEAGGARVTAYRIRHSGMAHRAIHNFVQVIEVGASRLVHLGDAEPNFSLFEGVRENEDPVDVALVPYWYFASQDGKRVINEVLRPRHTIAMHVAVPNLAKIRRQFVELAPDAILAADRGAEWRF